MERTCSPFWWLNVNIGAARKPSSECERDLSSSTTEFLENERRVREEEEEEDEDIDIPRILEEINRLSAQSPLGGYDQAAHGELSIEEIMQEAEKIYIESSKSFEQLSKSNTSRISEFWCWLSPKASMPRDDAPTSLSTESSDTSDEGASQKEHLPVVQKVELMVNEELNLRCGQDVDEKQSPGQLIVRSDDECAEADTTLTQQGIVDEATLAELEQRDGVIKLLLGRNRVLRDELHDISHELAELRTQATPNVEDALEAVRDIRQQNTALQQQLEDANKLNRSLRASYDELHSANHLLERQIVDLESALQKYKSDLSIIQSIADKVKENEMNANTLLEHERQQNKSMKRQMEKDSKCILDLTRQIKEMERIMARKHPDTVSALIIAAKHDDLPSARRVLEDRIRVLEHEASIRDAQHSQVFTDVQERFAQIKLKYESHIDDLELHVIDLKAQLKHRPDSFDVYTQTLKYIIDEKIPAKDTTNHGCQTEPAPKVQQAPSRTAKMRAEKKDDSQLLATIRGYQSDLEIKGRVIAKLKKDADELRRTNRRLQKEREGSLKYETKGSKSVDEERAAVIVKLERDQLKSQLEQMQHDFQALKAKRLRDLNTLQEAHEREINSYLATIAPLREQLEMQQVTVTTLQKELVAAKKELAAMDDVEHDHFNNPLHSKKTKLHACNANDNGNGDSEATALRKQLKLYETKYEERVKRLRAILHGLVKKVAINKSCAQCDERHQQMICYRRELDQIYSTTQLFK